jgi:CHAT domain-containing protein
LVTASPLISENLRQFYLYINKGDYNQAAKTIEKLSDSSMKLALSADLAYYQGQYDEAIALYEEASHSLDSQKIILNWSKALYQRGRFYEKLNVNGDNYDLTQLTLTDFSLASSKVDQLLQNQNSSIYLEALLLAAKLNKYDFKIDLEAIEKNILSLPDSHKKNKLLLELAEIYPKSDLWEKAFSLGIQLDNLQYQSLAQGNLGEIYLQQNNPQSALKNALVAQLAASKIHDWQSLIRWHYLAARSFQQLGEEDSAIAQYKLAVASIKNLRQQLSGNPISPHLYFDVVKPVLNDYLQLLLSLPSSPLEEVISLQQLDQLTQLDNYFQVICKFDIETPQQIIEKRKARIFFVELDNSIHAVVQLSNSLLHYPLAITPEQLRSQVKAWRIQLMNGDFEESFELGSILYRTILSPLMPTLKANKIEHLQFISNGVLRTVPIAALNNGETYLIEHFALSYSNGLRNRVSPSLKRDFLPLIAGLTHSTSNFPNPLKFAQKEARQVQTLLGGTILLNDRFSAESLKTQLQDSRYQILHLATHASFSFVRNRAFIETGTQTLSLNQFESILKQRRSPLQLLVLSACQTAIGDRYSALGLLGVGLRNNIDVVVGSFWEVGDSSTSQQMKKLYELWQQGASLPEALRQVQLGLIREGELPADWASFIVAFN